MDVGDLRVESEEHQAEYSEQWQRNARFAARNLEAARKAWQWTEKYPNVVFKNPQGINTGEYGDSSCSDERLWAVAKLWRTTGDATYNEYFVKQYPDFRPALHTPSPEA